MSVIIKVATVDRSENIEPTTFNLMRALTSQIDTFIFTLTRKEAGDWKPDLLEDVEITEDSVVLFGGQIIDISEEIMGGNVERVTVTCKDYGFELDRQLVVNTYEDQTVDSIITDIVNNFTSGITMTGVDAPVTIGYIAFNYEYPSKCLQQLAELIGYDWYIDENKDLHFFSKLTIPAPFNLTDDNESYYYDTLAVKHDVKNLRNTIIVRGGTFQGTAITEEEVADGDQTTFRWAFQYSNVVVKIDAVTQTVGTEFIHADELGTTYDCLYDFNNKSVRFAETTKPLIDEVVSITGNPHVPVIVKVRDPASEAEFGKFEYKVIDKSINSKQGARDRAQQELRGWANQIEEGSFETKSTGLLVGNTINVQSTKRGINQDYVISRIQTRLINGLEARHRVTLVTTQTYGMIEFLQMLLTQKDKEIEINENEIIDLVETFYETITIAENVTSSTSHNPQIESITIGETFTPRALNYATVFCAGSFAPDGVKRTFICDGSLLG